MAGKLVCFVGVDGTGKTTLAKMFVAQIVKKKMPARYVWFRFPYFLTSVVLITARILKLTKYSHKKQYRLVEHNFTSQPWRTLYPLVLLFDTLLYYLVKISLPKRLGVNIVCDRWIPDIAVDIMADTSNPRFENTLIGEFFKKFVSRATFTVYVDASDAVLQLRRPETAFDPTTQVRRSLYRSYAQTHRLNTVYSNSAPQVTFKKLIDLAEASDLNFNPPAKVYGTSNSLLRPFMKRRFFASAVNWSFQGTLIMTASEKVFRLLLEFVIAASVFVLLSFLTSIIISVIACILIAHTINWLFNGNFWAVQKFFGRNYNVERMLAFLEKIQSGTLPFQNSVIAVAAFGSLSRGQFKRSSDLDLRIVRKNGFANWVLANIFIIKLRSTSFLDKIPIDAFLLDNVDQMYEHISRKESPVSIYDLKGVLVTVDNGCILLEDVQRMYSTKYLKS